MNSNSAEHTDRGIEDAPDGDCCTASHSLTDEALLDDVAMLSAVGNETRYETLRYVAGAGQAGACVCELPPLVGVTQGTVSNALSRLLEAGLVSRRKEGRWRYYTATTEARTLLLALDTIQEGSDE
ncbi:ArsR/SmtB family transcription factor [Halohasta litorea]|uniref:ArsR/SmtB family transcription factor n=1 Tax=Halohasta litorea TaxID=869891 RepID=A0ABD6D564_9EURY|nr:metalloregulator ArsR/SmtB family transcription factor [Halohasta litorea]